MDAQSPAIQAERRAWNYYFDDGVPALVGGFGGILFGLSFIFDHSLFRLVLMGLYGVILLRHRPIIEWLKIRLTYPRTGYVRPPESVQPSAPGVEIVSLTADPEQVTRDRRLESEARKRVALSLVFLLPSLLGTMFIPGPWMFAVAGLGLAASLAVMNGKDIRLSWIVLGGIPIIGFVMAMFPPQGVTPAHRIGYFAVAIGLFICATGALALLYHLWRNPVASVPAK